MTDAPAQIPVPESRTERLALHRPEAEDLAALHALESDPRVWTHYPSLRPTSLEQTQELLARWRAAWERDGLGTWVVRDRAAGDFLGYGGCSLREGIFWNLGYRLRPEAQGHGFATEVARAAIERVRARPAAEPVVAYLVEHNSASAAVARRVGLTVVHRGPDAGNPDPSAVRLVMADRPLTDAELEAVMR